MLTALTRGLGGVAGAGMTAQFPAYYQQYLQRLGGRLDVLRDQARQIARDAHEMGLTVEAYIETFISSPQHALEGERMRETLAEARQAEQAWQALMSAAAWERPATLIRNLDADVAAGVFEIFRPGVQITTEGAVYAFTGGLIGVALVGLLGRLRRRARRRHGVA